MARLPFWLKAVLLAIPAVLLIGFFVLIAIGWYVKSQMLDSGGPLRPAMAAYDVRHYDLEVAIDPVEEAISGANGVTVEVSEPLDRFEIHLDDRLGVTSVVVDGEASAFEHDDGVITAVLSTPWRPGTRHRVEIAYSGRPKVAINAPWIDGFVWSETPSGEPWIGVTSELGGGDIWWPCKDHLSDEPDEGMDIALTVPEGLVGLSNGRRVGEMVNDDGTVTTTWRVGFPINDYCVTVNVGPHVPVDVTYRGVAGDLDETIVFWAIADDLEGARRMWQSMPRVLEVLGSRFGEYPFLADKLAAVHAPYLGMEHQTLIAYGDSFANNEYGFDAILVHEIAHEWWGNKVTASDWRDIWLHEGFATYAEALYVLETLGEKRYLEYMNLFRRRVTNQTPVVRDHDLTAAEAITMDVYSKGAWVLHMLRYLLGDEVFSEILWRFADGDNPEACRFATTEDFKELAAEASGRDLEWFWDRYLHAARLPEWKLSRSSVDGTDEIRLEWDDPSFEMPLPVWVGNTRRVVAMPGGRAVFGVDPGTRVLVDPKNEVLAANR
jgi:aminopeptidase N